MLWYDYEPNDPFMIALYPFYGNAIDETGNGYDGSVFEAPFCTMNNIYRPLVEKKNAKKLTDKVENEFDTSKGIKIGEIPEVIIQSR